MLRPSGSWWNDFRPTMSTSPTSKWRRTQNLGLRVIFRIDRSPMRRIKDCSRTLKQWLLPVTRYLYDLLLSVVRHSDESFIFTREIRSWNVGNKGDDDRKRALVIGNKTSVKRRYSTVDLLLLLVFLSVTIFARRVQT